MSGYFALNMHPLLCQLGLCPRPHWERLQHSSRPSSWITGGPLLRQGNRKEREDEGREEEGKQRVWWRKETKGKEKRM